MNNLTLVVPAYNEAQSLPRTLPPMLEFCRKHGAHLILVDDGSVDHTLEVLQSFASEPLLRVLSHKVNRGYGGALKTGIRAVETDYVMTLDADGQHRMEDVEKLCRRMIETDADLMIGRRPKSSSGWYRSLGKFIIRSIVRLLLPLTVRDINSGMKLYSTALAKRYLSLCPDHMAFSDIITLVFLSNRHRVLEEPIEVERRLSGRSTISTLTAIDTVREIVNIVILFNPMRIFIPIAMLLILIGVVLEVPALLRGAGITPTALLFFVTGLLFFCMGLLAEQLSTIRQHLHRD